MSNHRPDDIPNTAEITEDDLGVRGVPDGPATASPEQEPDPFRDTLFGPRDKGYLDFIARRVTKLRGTYVEYYVLTSQTEKLDDNIPVSKNRDAGPLDRVDRAGGELYPEVFKEAKGVSAMYGETVTIGSRLSSVEREVLPTWDYADPIRVRGVLTDPERAEIPDGRGSIFTARIRLWIARVLCDEEYEIRPRIGDVVRLPNLTNPPFTFWDYYDVEEVSLNNTRFGSTGFFTAYTLQLARSTRFTPDRKLQANNLKDAPDPPV